jgi:hypothetical protein
MKKILLLLTISTVLLTLLTVSCKKKEEPKEPEKTYAELIVGRWATDAAQPYYEVYNTDGTGHMWDTADDVQEDEADQFDWTMDEAHKQFTQIVHFQGGQGDVPQLCNILILNETTLKYNNDALKREVTLTRVQQ